MAGDAEAEAEVTLNEQHAWAKFQICFAGSSVKRQKVENIAQRKLMYHYVRNWHSYAQL